MKQGIILYVIEGREQMPDWPDERRHTGDIKADRVCTAFSEDDVHYHWCRLITLGMDRIFCVLVDYNRSAGSMRLRKLLRLCG